MTIFYRFVFLLLLLFATAPAFADVFVWKDQKTGLSVTFPDSWAVVHNQKPDDILTVAAPGALDYASCRVRVRDDKRFAIYPRKYDANIQHLDVSKDFWFEYLGEFSGANVHRYFDDAGLGPARASRVEMSFITPGQPKLLKRGFANAGLFKDKLYVFECSAEYDAYARWHDVFSSVLQSVQIDQPKSSSVFSGYRNVEGDSKLQISNGDPVDSYTY